MKSSHPLFSGIIIFVSVLAVVTSSSIETTIEKKLAGCFPAAGALDFLAPPSLWPLAPLEVVSELDIKAYQGRWYQYSSSIAQKVKQLFGKCVTVEHTTISADEKYSLFDIVTRYNMFHLPIVQKSSEIAFSTDEVGKFETTYGCQFAGHHYWVVDLGPKVNGKYQYAIVASSSSTRVRVLVRDLTNYPTLYKKRVDAKLKELQLSGFIVKQRKTNHKSCKYQWNTIESSAPQSSSAPQPSSAPQSASPSQPTNVHKPTSAPETTSAPPPSRAH